MAARCTAATALRADESAEAYYVRPALVEMPEQCGPVVEETFAPILYVIKYATSTTLGAEQRRAAGPLLVDLHQ